MSIGTLFNKAKQFALDRLPTMEIPKHVFIVGAQKAGTTALHSYLAKHPKMICAAEKELGFFSRDRIYETGTDHYRKAFPSFPLGTHALDSTPEYLYRKFAPKRIHAFRPDSKIIVVLREPVSRAFSAYNMYKQLSNREWFLNALRDSNADAREFYLPLANGSVEPDIDYFLDRELEIIYGKGDGEEPSLIRRGLYAPQIERFLKLFGSENVHILFSEALKNRPEEIVANVLTFLGLEPLVETEYPLVHVREYTADNSAKDKIRSKAEDLFATDRRNLATNIGLSVPW